jgi:hypothetical protein
VIVKRIVVLLALTVSQARADASPDSTVSAELRKGALNSFTYKSVDEPGLLQPGEPSAQLSPQRSKADQIHPEAAKEVGEARDAARIAASENASEIGVMDPLIVGAGRIPELKKKYEPPQEKFYRTGIIFEHIGKHVTRRLWFSSEKGLMMTFSR